MADLGYRAPSAPPLLPVPGARVHVLQREGNAANLAAMVVWIGTAIVVAVGSTLLDGRVPPWTMMLGPVFVLAGLVASGLAYRRLSAGGTDWRLHVSAQRVVLEQVGQSAWELVPERLAATRYEYQVRATRGAMPTVTITLPDGRTRVVSGPVGVGWVNLGEAEVLGLDDAPPPRSPAPHLRLDDAAAFEALRRLATR